MAKKPRERRLMKDIKADLAISNKQSEENYKTREKAHRREGRSSTPQRQSR